MGGEFFSDEGRNHCTVDMLHDLSRGTSFVSHFSNLPYHLLDSSRRTHIIGSFLESSRLCHKPTPFGEKRNEVAVDFIDLLTDFVQRGAKYIHLLAFLFTSLRLLRAGSSWWVGTVL